MNSKAAALSALALALAGPAAAAPIFSDNFQNAIYGGNVTPAGWTTIDGTVDALGPGYFGFLCSGAGGSDQYCVDLDGSTGDAGIMFQGFNLLANRTYTASFDLAGSFRDASNTVAVAFGGASGSYTLAQTDPFATHSLSFTPTTSGSYSLSFANAGGDNQGALLDNVSISGVPEPTGWAMMLLGFGGLGATLRTRRRATA